MERQACRRSPKVSVTHSHMDTMLMGLPPSFSSPLPSPNALSWHLHPLPLHLHPIPHHAPCAMHHAPCTMHHAPRCAHAAAPRDLRPEPCSLHHAPYCASSVYASLSFMHATLCTLSPCALLPLFYIHTCTHMYHVHIHIMLPSLLSLLPTWTADDAGSKNS